MEISIGISTARCLNLRLSDYFQEKEMLDLAAPFAPYR